MLRWLPAKDGVRLLGTEHIMLGLLSNGSHAAGKLLLAFDQDGFDRTVLQFDSGSGGSASNPRRAALRKALMQIVNEQQGDASCRAVKEVKEALKEVSLLDRYAPDLSSLAEEGLLEPFQGRSSLLQRLERSLARRLKPNVLLVGDPGTGKTALVEALAQRLPRTTSPWLRGKRIRRLDVARLTAGTRLRGDFEERLQLVLQNLEVEPVINTMSDSKCMYELKTYL